MSNKLDDRYVEYDLDSAINILPIENGGTGRNVITPGEVIISNSTGEAAPFDVELKASGITAANLNALQNIGAGSTIETRIAAIENNHVAGVGSKIHVPASGVSNQYLKSVNAGNPVWQSGLLPTTGSDANYVWSGNGSWIPVSTGVDYIDPSVVYGSTVVDITTSQTWNIPAGVKLLSIQACAGGGGGGRATDGGVGQRGGTGGNTSISGVVTCYGGKGGYGIDIGNGPTGQVAAAGAQANLIQGQLTSHGLATAGGANGGSGLGGYNEFKGSYNTYGSSPAYPQYAGNGGPGGNPGNWRGGGGGGSPVVTFLLDVALISSLSITIGAGGYGGTTGGWPGYYNGYAGSKGIVKINYV